ncbi:MAG: DUF2357 domain-containing protein [Clostridium sp.]|uniref:DUF2357 domain-containing protein n=1 Tax=Clostridium sp. TaxID=1506 RepID=UPI003D6D65A9
MDTIKWLEKRPHLLGNIDGRYIPAKALQVTKQVTLDTKENRFLKFMLIKIIEKIDNFIRTYSSTPWEKNEEVMKKLKEMKREIYKYYLMLQKGLSINSNIFSLSMKEIS